MRASSRIRACNDNGGLMLHDESRMPAAILFADSCASLLQSLGAHTKPQSSNILLIEFWAVIKASLMAIASAASGDEHKPEEFVAVRSLPSLYLNMTTVAYLQVEEENAASVFNLAQPFGGGRQKKEENEGAENRGKIAK
ncbi:hypothetical protein PIB30_007481 [Stylosanthes scabra]|uniref:Uncharacterized protein n=1 Tax=Stylosanthes scabra TaxID=79078 RepID=A0ABU6S523_9FABA|nr:hypothetical protein [Stylosanthes scabra]